MRSDENPRQGSLPAPGATATASAPAGRPETGELGLRWASTFDQRENLYLLVRQEFEFIPTAEKRAFLLHYCRELKKKERGVLPKRLWNTYRPGKAGWTKDVLDRNAYLLEDYPE